MNIKKDLIIKIGIGIFALIFGYSVFWFFKAGQIEKQLNKFISDNSSNISVAELSVTGFPVAQKISITDLKFSIPTPLFNKKQVLIKNLILKSSVFGGEYALSSFAQVSVNDIEKGSMNIEFSKDPEISFTIANGTIEKFNYQDMGYRIIDNDKSTYYSASKSQINILNTFDEQLKNIIKITGNINDIEGYTVMSAYKSSLEKKIIEGIKTEEIVIGSSPTPENSDVKQDAKKPNENNLDQKIANQTQPNPSPNNPAQNAQTNPSPQLASEEVNQAKNNNSNSSQQASNNTQANQVPAPATNSNVPTTISAQNVPSAISDSNIVKSNVIIDVEYQISSSDSAQVPSDPSQVKEIAIQSSKIIKVNNIEFSNPLYKLSINGQLTILPDDNLPSGGISIKVENIDNLVNQIINQIGLVTNQNKVALPEGQSAENALGDASINESYKNFLRRIAINLTSVNREIASKNPVTKEIIAQYDIRREKNLDFIINEVSIHEILGKF